jgi:hypothetical protein
LGQFQPDMTSLSEDGRRRGVQWLLLLLLFNLSQIFTMTLINNIHNKLQDNTRDWNVEQDLRPN